MLEFLLDNIFVVFDGQIFQQTIGIPVGTNCAPLLADRFLYSYEEFIQGLLNSGKKKLAQSFNFTYRYIDDVFSRAILSFQISSSTQVSLILKTLQNPRNLPHISIVFSK